MKKILIFIFLFLVCGNSAYARIFTLEEILAAPDNFDGKRIVVQGEVIGDFIQEGEGVWFNLFSRGYNIGVFLPQADLAEAIRHRGSYKEQGDDVRISGVFFKECSLHQERDIHATIIKVVEKGGVRPDVVSDFKIQLLLKFFIICLTVTAVYFIKLGYTKMIKGKWPPFGNTQGRWGKGER